MSTSEGKCVLVEVGALISWCIYSYRIVMLLVPYMWASMTFLPKQVWKDNDLWFGAHHDGHECRTGFWGELKDPYEHNKKTFCFLGYTKSHVIPRMKTYLSFS